MVRPSPFVLRCIAALVVQDEPTAIDVPCGYGRHTRVAIQAGYRVTAIDIDAARIAALDGTLRQDGERDLAQLIVADAANLERHTLGPFSLAIITDFANLQVVEYVASRLLPGGHLIFETFAARGGNWRSLPKAGLTASCLAATCDLLNYKEKSAGAAFSDVVSVKCLARRR